MAGLAKKPWRVRCPPLELDFFNVDGVGVGVDDIDFLAIPPISESQQSTRHVVSVDC